MLRTYLERNFDWVLFYQREFWCELMLIWHTFLLLTFDHRVHICFLDQIFSLCYLFFRHAFYIIFDFHRDERCKFHIRYRDDQRVKKTKSLSIRDDFIFNTKSFYQLQWRWRNHFHVFSTTISRFEFCEIKWYSVKRFVETRELLVEIRE